MAFKAVYPDLYDALDRMEVGDCLRWKLDAGQSKRRMLAAVSHRYAYRGARLIRALAYFNTIYFVRLA